ncbi:MAG: Argininosuccinate synthase [Candidatus Woesearchaeota archaeon]|nr:Argininosuccinate synthase [Candidatus Woesearchaeota archaeon]
MKQKISSYEAQPEKVNKVLLLFSGGLDTSCMIKWIEQKYDAEVITLTVDVGQPGIDLKATKQKALKLGAKKAFIVDAKKEFAQEYIAKAIKLNALYQGEYPLSTAIARPLKAKHAVKIAEQENVDAIAHGSTGKGNDQVRFDISITTLDPKMKIIAPVREWSMGRDEELKFAKKHGIPLPTNKGEYSTDENIWGKSSECGILEHPQESPPEDVFQFVTIPEKAPDKSEIVEIEFEKGIPIKLNGKLYELHKLVQKLNLIGGKHAVGIIDHMEDRVVGLKSREVYECPAATILLKAHKDLEKFTSTIHQNKVKPLIDQKWGEMAYYGLWFDPLMKSLESFADKMNEAVSGKVKVKLYKGKATVVGRESKNALYDLNLATYDKKQTFNQLASPGFIELFGLQTKLINQIQGGLDG